MSARDPHDPRPRIDWRTSVVFFTLITLAAICTGLLTVLTSGSLRTLALTTLISAALGATLALLSLLALHKRP